MPDNFGGFICACHVSCGMTEKQSDAMIRQSVRVPPELYEWACHAHDSFSETCRLGLQKLREIEEDDAGDNQLTVWQTQADNVVHTLLDVQATITGTMKQELDFKNEQIKQLSITCDTLLAQLVEERAKSRKLSELQEPTGGYRWWQIWKR